MEDGLNGMNGDLFRIKKYMLFIIFILTLSACSEIHVGEVKEIEVKKWIGKNVQADSEFIVKEETINHFVEATNGYEKLEKQNVIKTPPVLTYTIVLEDGEGRGYHLWLTKDGKGYIQSLIEEDSLTYRLKEESVAALKKDMEEAGGVEPTGEIEFE
ncbi:hypothetical protein HF072_05220 [Bacillus sp. RO3]|nr:hypothetical protein [Bacillus sp. RO3]